MKKYMIITSYLGSDDKFHHEEIECDTFAEAADEFNTNCACFTGSTIWLDTESDIIIRQCIKRYDCPPVLK